MWAVLWTPEDVFLSPVASHPIKSIHNFLSKTKQIDSVTQKQSFHKLFASLIHQPQVLSLPQFKSPVAGLGSATGAENPSAPPGASDASLQS